ncbi:hypothetical protein [Streptomyces sp. NPDC093984]|uniref:hypothetical protein n=1 Tax=Streptomyces sp. NPDC093984 TaxID=3366052 RepID=UPI003821262E
MELRANTPSCAAVEDTGSCPAARTSGETTVGAPFGRPVREQLEGVRSLRAAWDDYKTQVSGLCAVWAECGWSAASVGRGGLQRSLADVAEQHDALIRRLDDWPAIDVWNADLAVAVRAAEAQLASLLSAWLGQDSAARATAHERIRMALAAGDLRRLGQALSALRAALCAVEPTDD